MGSNLIDGLMLTSLRQIHDERGAVFHFLKSESVNFRHFGESYFSKINEGVVKGWKLHFRAFQNMCVPVGRIKFVVYDVRRDSQTFGMINEIILDDSVNYHLLSLPSNIWYSFRAIDCDFALLANISSELHDINECIQLPLENDVIEYRW